MTWNDSDCDPVRDMREHIERLTEGHERWGVAPGYCLTCKGLVDVRCPIYFGTALSFMALCIQCGNPTVKILGSG